MSDFAQNLSENKKATQQGVTGTVDEVSTLLPEGGLQGWLCCAGGSLGLFSTLGFLNAVGVFQTSYEETLLKDYTASQISWIFTVQLSLVWASGPVFGRLIDTYGPRLIMILCSILCVFALCMTSLSTKYYQIILAQGVCYGLGAGGVFTASLVSVGQWFVKQRGLAMGITVGGSSIGGVIFPFFLEMVMQDVGFKGMVRYTALLIGITLLGAIALVSPRLPPKKWDSQSAWIDIKLFTNTGFAFYAIGSYFIMWGLWAPFDYLPSMAESSGMSASLSVYLISIVNAASLFGRIIPGYIGDKFGYFNVITASGFLSSLTIFCLWMPFDFHFSTSGIIAFSIVYGFFSGAFVSIMMPCCARSGRLETLGQQIGTYQGVIALSTLTGLPIMGAILDQQNGSTYDGMQIFAGASMLIGSIFLLLSRNVLAKVHKTWNY